MTLIVGIDPGLNHTGWGVVSASGNALSFVACGVIHTNVKNPISERLHQLYHGITQVMHTYHPQESAVEETFVNKNNASSLKLGQARGAILLSLSLGGVSVSEYGANLVKKSVVGTGHADKKQVAMMVKTLLPASDAVAADASDALAVAICHSHQRHLKKIHERVEA